MLGPSTAKSGQRDENSGDEQQHPCRVWRGGRLSFALVGNLASLPVKLALLGDPTLFGPTGTKVSLSPQRVHILTVIGAAAGSVVSRASLLEDLWGKDDAASRHRLKSQIAQTRSLLGPELSIEFHLDGYRLCGPLELLDSTLFESLVTTARQLSTADAATHYERALALWRGPFAFQGIDSLLVDDARRSLDMLRAATVIDLADCEIALGRPRASVESLQQIFQADPTRGDVATRLASLFALSTRQIEAMRVINRHREALAASGLSPAADLVTIEGRILRHDLVATSAATAPAIRHWEPAFRPTGRLIHRGALEQHVLAHLDAAPVILSGEAGVGKSTIATSVAAQLEKMGRTVIRVGAQPDPSRPMEVMADLVEQLSILQPVLLQHYLEDPSADAAVARLTGDRDKLFRAITREQLLVELIKIVRGVMAASASLLVVEDAHWLDQSTAGILGSLVAEQTPNLLVTTRRPLAELFGTMWSSGVTIEMPPFTVAEVRQLVDQVLPARASDDLAETLHQGTGGNGLFLRLKLDVLADGQLGRDLPPTLVHAVHERTNGFSRSTRDAMQTAALLGQVFPLAPLLRVHPNVREALHDAIEERLVQLDDEAGVGEFMHGVVVDALLDLLPAATRTTRHDQLCSALIALNASPITIAKHAVGSEELDPVRAVESCLGAALQQAQVFEWAPAIEWARLGLRCSERFEVDDLHQEAALHAVLGRGLRRLNLPGSDHHLSRAADLAFQLADHELHVRCVTELCLHGPTSNAGTVDQSARTHLDRALAAPATEVARAELRSAGATLLALSDESSLGRTLYREALDLAEARADPDLLRTIWINAHLGLSHPADCDARRRATAGLLALDDYEARWEGSFLGLGLALIDADRVALEATIAELRRLTAVVKQRHRDGALYQAETVSAFVGGDLDEAARLADAMFEKTLGSYPISWVISSYTALLLPIRDAQGRAGELQSQIAALIESSPRFITWHAVSAIVAYAAGDECTMTRGLDCLRQHGFQLVEDLTWTAIATLLSRPIRANHDRASARVLYSQLLPYAGTMTWNGLSTHGPVDAGLACLADVLEDGPAVLGHLATSRALVERLGAAHLWWPELSGLAEQWGVHARPRVG
jgi:DNA-binding SARP family transcriptional activator